MCGLVKQMELGVQSYLMARANEPPISRYAFMTRISTNIPTSQVFPAAEMEEDNAEKERIVQLQQLETMKLKRRLLR